jgi:hypothetical protein
LVESIKKDSVVKRDEIFQILPHECISYEKALELAFQKIAQNEVVSTWMDAWDIKSQDPSISHFIQVPTEGCLIDEQKFLIQGSKPDAIERIWRIGGDTGYYAMDFAWKIRGLIDQMIGGVGLNRGRRHPTEIQVGDSIDFWRVLRADKDPTDLILFAAMKVPGEAWLEYKLVGSGNEWMLVQRATFRPKGVFGRLYWYLLSPFHFFIFKKMAKAIAGK